MLIFSDAKHFDGYFDDMANDRITVDQERFLAARLAFKTDSEAAKSLGLHPDTPAQWKNRSVLFRQRYEALGMDARRYAVKRLQNMFDAALGVLEESMHSENERVKLKAAELALSYGGLLRGGTMNITVREHTEELLESLRALDQPRDVIDGEWTEKEALQIEEPR